MNMNKKGYFPGWQYIASFFVASIILVFSMGFYDFSIVEIYDPIHQHLEDSLVAQGNDNGLAYQEFVDNETEVKSKTLPFNLFYIFIFLYAIVFSLFDVASMQRIEPIELIYKSIGGIVFFIYVMQIVILKIVSYFQVQVVEYLFEDLITSYIPFYIFTYSNAGLIILIWAVALILTNWYLGKTKSELTGVFGQ